MGICRKEVEKSKSISTRTPDKGRPAALYISYDGLTEPLGQSQILPYVLGLSKRGIRFIMLTFDKKAYRAQKDEIAETKKRLKEEGILWVSLPYHNTPRLPATFCDVLVGFFTSSILVTRYKINIVHARSYVAALVAFLLKRVFLIRFIFDMRNFWADERIESGTWPRACSAYRMAKYFESKFLKTADEIVVLTNRAKEVLCNLDFLKPENISVIPCSVDLDSFTFDASARDKYRRDLTFGHTLTFLHAGSLESWYRLADMFDFVKVLKDIGHKIHFMILSHQKKDVLNLARRIGLEDTDLTLVSIKHSRMPQYISLADVGIFFISPTPCRIASLPTKFAEYLSCGIPVVCSTGIGDLDEIVTKNRVGVLITDFNKTEYRKKSEELLELLKDRELKARCRRVATNLFSLESAVDKYYQTYKIL